MKPFFDNTKPFMAKNEHLKPETEVPTRLPKPVVRPVNIQDMLDCIVAFQEAYPRAYDARQCKAKVKAHHICSKFFPTT
jgi:hypothetical protein